MEGIAADKITLLRIKDSGKTLVMPFLDNSDVKAGFPSPAGDYIEEEIDLKKLMIKHPSATFMVQVTGDSMKDAFVSDPARLIIDRAVKVQNNDMVLAVVNGEFTVKFYCRKGDDISLVPANEKYKPIEILDGMTFSVVGVVTFVLIEPRKVNNVRPRRLQ